MEMEIILTEEELRWFNGLKQNNLIPQKCNFDCRNCTDGTGRDKFCEAIKDARAEIEYAIHYVFRDDK